MENTIGSRLVALRKKVDMSQSKLAEQLGVTRQAVSRWECGESLPDTYNVIALARLFDVAVDDLLGLAEGKDPILNNEPEAEPTLWQRLLKSGVVVGALSGLAVAGVVIGIWGFTGNTFTETITVDGKVLGASYGAYSNEIAVLGCDISEYSDDGSTNPDQHVFTISADREGVTYWRYDEEEGKTVQVDLAAPRAGDFITATITRTSLDDGLDGPIWKATEIYVSSD